MSVEQNVIVRPFKKEDINQVTEILLNSFRSKFHVISQLPERKQITFLIDSGFVCSLPFDGYIVAENKNSVVGVMLLKWKYQKRSKPNKKVSFFRLIRNYGLFRVVKILISFLILEESITKEECYIEHIAVTPEVRSFGIGTKLLNYALNYTDTILKLSTTSLYVANSNTSAQKLYERMEFEICQSKKSLITQFIFHEPIWNYMSKNHRIQKTKSKFVMKSGWWFGFLGLLGLPHIKILIFYLKGEVPVLALLGLLWFLWFSLFIPQKRI